MVRAQEDLFAAPPPIKTPGSKPDDTDAKIKGTRLAADFSLPHEWRGWAKTELARASVNLDLDREAEKFRDYWLAKPGREGVKASWRSTWRNWIRKAVDYEKPRQQHGSNPLMDAFDELEAEFENDDGVGPGRPGN